MGEQKQVETLEREILGQAEERAAAALERGRRIVRRIAGQAERRAEEMLREAERELAPRREAERARALAVAELEMKRESASRREELVKRAFDEARGVLAGWRDRPDRDEVLARLVREAVRVLPGNRFGVELAPEDAGRWDEAQLSNLAGELSKETGRKVSLDLVRGDGFPLGGARVTSEDGRTRVDQTFGARIERLAEDLRRTIYGMLFTSEGE